MNYRFVAISKNGPGYIPWGPITFDSTEVDYDGNFDETTGTFTASRDGMHAFFFNGWLGGKSNYKYIDVYVNGDQENTFEYDQPRIQSHATITEFWSLSLKKGDTVYLNNRRKNQMYVSSDRHLYFMGYYVE